MSAKKGKRRAALEGAEDLAPGLARRPESVRREEREDETGRTWAERNRAVSLRIREEDAERLAAEARRLGMSRDRLGRALMWAALDALDGGWLELDVEDVTTEVEDRAYRTRIYVRREAQPRWEFSACRSETILADDTTQR